ncbi:MAG: rod shape-determining protein MreD [Candidatus Omnitrophota bacterium]|nr:rod shape-determining protein MreD [Candidatus Omnitrophota bacterium]
MYKIARFQIYLILAAAIFLQGGLLNYVKILGAKPDLILICVIFFGLFLGPAAGLESGFAAGMMKDIFALDFLWINAFILGITGLTAGAVNTKFFKESKRADFVFVFLFTVFSMALHYAIVLLLSNSMSFGFSEFFVSSVIPSAFYTAFVSIPVYVKLLDIYNLKEAEDYL